MAMFGAMRPRDVTEGERIFAAARQPKAFHPLLEADHLVTDRRAASELVEVAAGWFRRTLQSEEARKTTA